MEHQLTISSSPLTVSRLTINPARLTANPVRAFPPQPAPYGQPAYSQPYDDGQAY